MSDAAPRLCACGCGEALDPASAKVYASSTCRRRASRHRARSEAPAQGGGFAVPRDTAGTTDGARAAVEGQRAARYRHELEANGAAAAARWIRLAPMSCVRGEHDLAAWPGGAVTCLDCGGRVTDGGAMEWAAPESS